MRLVLASSSPYRQQLLRRLGLSFSCANPNITEQARAAEAPDALAQRLAVEKARAVAAEHPNALIIGSDQVAWLDGDQLHKPGTLEKNREQLHQCSGKVVDFYTGLALINTTTSNEHCVVERFSVGFRRLTETQIAQYVSRERAIDCAGGFKMEGLGIALFEYMRGDDPNSLIGLPLIQLQRLLLREGIDVLDTPRSADSACHP